jgi:hypothetical protein
LNAQLAQKTILIRSLGAKAANTRANLGDPDSAQPASQKKLQGGETRVIKKRLARILQAFLDKRYEKEAQPKALLSHFQRNPEQYKLILESIKEESVSLTSFLAACESHPEWLNPIRREVVTEIEKFWTAEKCLSIQLHCKVGHSGKYQHLINLASKTYDPVKKTWVHKELFESGSGVFVPKFP